MSGSPFFIIPWDKDFIESLSDIIVKETDGQLGSALVVFTHDRPKRYLFQRIRNRPDIPKPCLLPQTLTIQELWTRLSVLADMGEYYEIGLLDQVAVVFSCVQKLSFPSMLETFFSLDLADFFPWGVRLVELIEECFIQGVEPEDLLYAEGETDPFAAALLGSLGQIFSLYKDSLIKSRQTTPGLKGFLIAEAVRRNKLDDPFAFFNQKKIFFAGFGRLSGTEEVLLRHLWGRGAYVCLHVDAEIAANPEKAHWSCAAAARWIRSWKAGAELVCSSTTFSKNWRFFSGYDLHSQLETLSEDLQALDRTELSSAAVVLTHSGLLLPTLRHLPEKDLNISLGYPLDSSLLFQLLELIFGVCDSRREDGSIHYRKLLELLRHPYLRLLEEDGLSLREPLRHLERVLLSGGRRLRISSLMERLDARAENEAEARVKLLKHSLKVFVGDWFNARTLSSFAEALGAVCETLLVYGGDMWDRFPLDAECLFRLIHKVIPSLKNTGASDTPFPWEVLKSMSRALICAERVPFEADPLTGLQVLGMLETRLLRFSKVFLIDVTEDRLPGAPMKNPLLPDSLRSVVGLPDMRHRDELIAYNFYRLLAGANDVYLYWQEGIEAAGLFDGKKQRGRFVEEILWEEEQRVGSPISLEDPYIRSAKIDARPPKKGCRSVVKTQLIRDRLAALLGKPLSATLLDSYLSCPLRFYFERLCAVRPMEYLCEDDDRLAVGRLLHKVLYLYYKEHVGKALYKSKLSEASLRELFFEEFHKSGLMDALPPESAMMLRISGPEKLTQFLYNQPEKTDVLHVEQFFQTTHTIHGKNRVFEGVLDRVDRRDNGVIILDYKTGLVNKNANGVWKENDFFASLAGDFVIEKLKNAPDDALLSSISKRIPSLQLPYYMFLYSSATGEDARDAAYVSLKEDGKERWFLGGLAMEIKEDTVFENVVHLLTFLLAHMEYCPEFRPREGKHCSWCSWSAVCKTDISKVETGERLLT